ncbi:alpha/beta hydrolase [Paraburkholderia sp. D15]|uniref:alpha/beta fold hydrolase n=1 Tax=Paraburkholderia sp. D15 TaxID=2880218 RepID=UPI002478D75A|nr:alpha/beta hydrolase [Paraburkholderia sp. D15]WGS53265.1 alpha/beta hydrolase [Paraburkholderia sp. D15]
MPSLNTNAAPDATRPSIKSETHAALTLTTVDLDVQGVGLKLSTMFRPGPKPPILFLHGFGSTKEDYADIVLHPEFDGHAVIAYDAPGCGASECTDLKKISIPFLVETARGLLAHFSVDTFHVVGHSMGGLTALMLADAEPDRVLGFADIEGNVAPEDCFLSRQVVDFPNDDDDVFFEKFIERTWHSNHYASALYAADLRHRVRAGAVKGIFASMVELSDHGHLMERFLALPCPTLFMHGEQNDGLSYLPKLRENGVTVARIQSCGHFPMYSNPVEMWRTLSRFFGYS